MRQSWFTLLLFAVVVSAGTTYHYILTLGGRGSLPRAVYDTLQLIIFQRSNLTFPTDPIGESLYFLLPVFGLMVLVQGVLNFGRRVLDKCSGLQSWHLSLATTFNNHVIECGLGRLGWRAVTRLMEAKYEVVVIEHDFQSHFVARALEAHVPVITGDARETLTLQQAGLRRACWRQLETLLASPRRCTVPLSTALTPINSLRPTGSPTAKWYQSRERPYRTAQAGVSRTMGMTRLVRSIMRS